MDDISQIATNLALDRSGIWVSRGQSAISYPSEGNDLCFAIEETSFWFRHRNAVITALVRAFSPDQAFFDIGGGNGYVALALQRAGIDTVLLEPGPNGARNGAQRGVKVVVQSTLQDAGFKPASLPACGLFDVLEHIEDDAAFLRNLYDYIQPGGYVFLTVPAFNALWSIDDDHAGHYRRYSTASLAEKLTSAGLSVCYASYFFSLLVPAVFLFRTMPSRLGLRQSVQADVIKGEHAAPSGMVGKVLDRFLALERDQIARGRRVPAGGSCVAIAQRPA